MPLMSLAEYARHRGVSKPAVTYAIRDGRIQTTTDHYGKKRIDSEIADRAWPLNITHGQKKDPPPSILFPAEMISIKGSSPSPTEHDAPYFPPPPSPTVQVGFDAKALGLPDKPTLESSGSDNSYASARAYKEHFLARQAELVFLENAGKLLGLEGIKKKWASIASLVRTKVLGIPSKAKQRIPDLTNEQYFLLEAIIREALEDLSTEGESI
jgi:hypothetical protein